MIWTTLRLNMLPITAVQVQYACQTLTNLHNALADALTKQSSPMTKNFPIKSVPLFTSAQNFVPITIEKSKILTNEGQNQKMTYRKLIVEYEKIKEQIKQQILQLNKFYIKNSHDSSASLFHMLRLRLERVLFDCNTQKSQMKKVLTSAEQQKQYKDIAKQFQSKNSKISLTNQPKKNPNPDTKFLQSWDTFKTQNYPGYENDSLQISQNQLFQLDRDNFEKLNFDLKPSIKNEISQKDIQSKSKFKKSISPTNNNQKPNQSKSPTSKNLLKKQPTSQLTIATEKDYQKNRIPPKQTTKNITKLQNDQKDQKSFKNIKVLTTNNLPAKTTGKKQIEAKIPKQTFSNTYTNSKIVGSLKPSQISDKANSYSALNQKKDETKKKLVNVNENQGQKPSNSSKIQGTKKQQIRQKSPSKTLEKTQNLSPKKVAQELSKSKAEPKKPSPLKSPKKQDKKEEKDMKELKNLLMSSGSELRFTIKMSRQEYKSLLEFKNKMNNKKS